MEKGNMEMPNLEKMWETFIKIGKIDLITPNKPFVDHAQIIQIIRRKISPMIAHLENEGVINWYSFLIHDKRSGVPTTEDDDNLYFHIRFSLKNDFKPSLPDYCVMTRKIKREWVKSISGIDQSLLRNGQIEEAWRIIGEQSKWFIDMLSIYKEDVEIPPRQIKQFLHFFANMTQLKVR
jgi:hypothetical protein